MQNPTQLSRALENSRDVESIAEARRELKRQTEKIFDEALRKTKSRFIKLNLELRGRLEALAQKDKECRRSIADITCRREFEQMRKEFLDWVEQSYEIMQKHTQGLTEIWEEWRYKDRRRTRKEAAERRTQHDSDTNPFSLATITRPLTFIRNGAMSISQDLIRNTAKMSSDIIGNIPPGNQILRPFAGGALPPRSGFGFVPR